MWRMRLDAPALTASRLGWLVTQVTWKDREPAVVSQSFDWQAEAAEDVLR